MDISAAVEWWEEWQLRILVLCSLFVQWILLLSSTLRKLPIPSWLRSIIWLAYLGSDSLAIYALAALFTRQRRQDCNSGKGNSILEVVWAPVLLMHLGGQDLITAYNIEDNELWIRHVATAVSQITVAIFVFCTSWPGGDNRLLQAAILLFVPGIFKCMEKPWALKRASINSLVSPSIPPPRRAAYTEGSINSVEDYVQKARAFFKVNSPRQAQEGDAVDLEANNHLPQAQGDGNAVELDADHQPRPQGEAVAVDLEPNHHRQTSSIWRSHFNKIKEKVRSHRNRIEEKRRNRRDQRKEKIRIRGNCKVDLEAYKLFVDLASPYPDRLDILKSFWMLDGKQACALLQYRLLDVFDLLYTKKKMISSWENSLRLNTSLREILSTYIRVSAMFLPWATIGLFHYSHREAYNDNDVKVTYTLFCCTAVLESYILNFAFSGQGVLGLETRVVDLDEPGEIIMTWLKRARGKVIQWQWVNNMFDRHEQIKDRHEQIKAKVMQLQWLKICVSRYEWARGKVTRWDRVHKQAFGKWQYILHEQFLARINFLLKDNHVGQYTLVGFFARNKRHSRTMAILDFFSCKDFFDQHWSMKPCSSSLAITELVLKYLKKGWEDELKDSHCYWKFNDHRGQWTLLLNKCDKDLAFSLKRPFDESVLLWHIATDFCFYYISASADGQCVTAQCFQDEVSSQDHRFGAWCERCPHHERAVRCRELSNYMMYLLFVNPEMLMPGTRRNLFLTANDQIEEILKDDEPSLEKILKDQKKRLEEIESGIVQLIISKIHSIESREQALGCTEPPMDADINPTIKEGFVKDAWKISKALLALGDEKMWEVIEGVWVEMLCFSASRCRGYLHAKSLGTGLELLTYIWLLLWHMGMETLPERLQRTELSSGEGNAGGTPSTSQIHDMQYPTRFRRLRPDEEAAAGASTSQSQEIQPAE